MDTVQCRQESGHSDVVVSQSVQITVVVLWLLDSKTRQLRRQSPLKTLLFRHFIVDGNYSAALESPSCVH